MARPREFDRALALRKARDAFWSRGYEATSMADLVDVLGLASARIYAAFGSKDDLFREAVELYETTEGCFVLRALEHEPTARAAVKRMLGEAIETYTRPGRAWGCMVVSAATNCTVENDALREWLAERRRRQTALISERLARGIRDGDIKADTDAAVLGDFLATVMHGLSVQARDGVSRKRLMRVADHALQIVPEARSRGRRSPER
jgi:AcrR family transcriptional regulator